MAVAQHSPLFEKVRPRRLFGASDLRSDEALIKAAQSGRTDAASQLIERHYPRVFSFVSYLTNRKSQAEDLTQEVFARALTSLGTFNGRYQFQPWLIKIARNLVIDEARKDVHRAAPTDPEDLPELEAVDPDADRVWSTMSQQIASSEVKRVLARLPIRQRTALVLREIEEMSYAEISQVLGTNVRGVEGTLRRAKARFRLEASAAEAEEGREAVCRRALRLVALDGEAPGSEADRHLQSCAACRAKSRSIKASDSLFAALPALTVAQPEWQASLVSQLLPNPAAAGLKVKLQRLLDSVKELPGAQAGGPLAHLAQVVAPLAVAGAVSVAGVAGYKQVQQHLSPSAELAVPTFTQEFHGDPERLPASYVDHGEMPQERPAPAPRPRSSGANVPAAPPEAKALLGSVIDLLSAELPGVPVRDLPLQSQLNLLSELPSPALVKIAETLNLPSVPTEKEELLKVIKEALVKAPPAQTETVGAAPVSPDPAPTSAAGTPSVTEAQPASASAPSAPATS